MKKLEDYDLLDYEDYNSLVDIYQEVIGNLKIEASMKDSMADYREAKKEIKGLEREYRYRKN